MIKKILFSIILVLCVLLISQTATAATMAEDLKTIAKKVMINSKTEIMDGFVILSTKENISGTPFDYTWDIHRIRIWLSQDNVPRIIEFEYKKYQNSVNSGSTWKDATGCEQFLFFDENMDGILDRFIKDYYLVVDGCIVSLSMIWPKGLVSPDYFNPSDKQKNKLYRDEISYWLNKELTTEL